MNRIFCLSLLLFIFTQFMYGQSKKGVESFDNYSATPWSIRMADSEIKRRPGYYMNDWGYVPGTFLKGLELLWDQTGNDKYYQYIKNSVDQVTTNTGSISGYNYDRHSLDEINEGRIALFLFNKTSDSKYKIIVDTLRAQLRTQPRTYDGGFWHRDDKNANTYPHQMWLDGLYMANPFCAEYGIAFNDTFALSDVVAQLTVMEKHARDSVIGLLYHGWDESKTQAWADPVKGCSPSFWGRGDGWYIMAAVDVLDYFPADHPGRNKIISIIQRLAEALKKVQDPVSGTWWQVLDMGGREGNYHESSASCMFVYALSKSIRLGYIDKSYMDVVKKGYAGILNEFITINSDSSINLIKTCATAGLGGNPYRSGTFDYYVNQTSISTNDGKATGPFIMASLEVEKADLVMPPLNFSSKLDLGKQVLLTWNDKSFNADFFSIERKKEGEQNFKEIASVPKGINSFIDSTINLNTVYFYRARSISDTTYSDYSNIDSVNTNPASIDDETLFEPDFKLYQNYPNPFNPETRIGFYLAKPSKIKIVVFDILGKTISILFNGSERAGFHYINFDGSKLSSGVYLYKLFSNGFIETRKMVLLR